VSVHLCPDSISETAEQISVKFGMVCCGLTAAGRNLPQLEQVFEKRLSCDICNASSNTAPDKQ
jgi:hypothetical protein